MGRDSFSLLHVAKRGRPHPVAASNGHAPARAARSDGSHPQPWEVFRHELDRSRRYGRPFALLSLGAGGEDALETVRRLTRGVDCVWADGDRVYALLPECTRASGSRLIERIRAVAPSLAADARCVGFPEDAMTGAGLLAAARAPREARSAPAELALHRSLAASVRDS